jgi:MFS family permease
MVNTSIGTYLTVFTGNIPYDEWTCVSKKCSDLLKTAQSSDEFYSYDNMCKNDLVAGLDFEWTSKRSTFSIEWGFYCKNEAKLSLVSSVLFIGTFLGLLFSTGLYERVGRKRSAIYGSFLSLAAVALSSVASDYIILLFLRITYGFGLSITYMGTYCWLVELAPTFLRNPVSNLLTLGGWTTGFFALIGMSYFIHQWQYVYLAAAGIDALAILPFFFLPLPESPRFSLLKGRNEEAKKTLRLLAQMSDNKVSFDKIDLVYEEKNQSYFEQMKDFKGHPKMLKETLLGMCAWFIVALVSFSYQFGWSKFGNDLHSIYSFAAFGEGLSFIIAMLCCRLLGRKKATLFFFLSVIAMNAVAMLDVKFDNNWSLEQLVSMIGNIGAGAAFVMMYLFSGELAPTSHRGMILCLCSSCARVGSFIGPYVNLLYGVTDRRVPLALFAGLSLLACVVVWFLPDTTGKSVPETPEDVGRSSGKRREEDTGGDEEAFHVVVNGLNSYDKEKRND